MLTSWRLLHPFPREVIPELSTLNLRRQLRSRMKLHPRSTGSSPNTRRRDGSAQNQNQNHNRSPPEHRRDNPFCFRGSVVQDVWEATQRTVKLRRAIGGNKNKEQGEDSDTKDMLPEAICPSKRNCSQRNTCSEKRNQFQLVMDEFKAKTKARINSKDDIGEANKSSPTCVEATPFGTEHDTEQSVSLDEDCVTDNLRENEGSRGTRNWIQVGGIFQKTRPKSSVDPTDIALRSFQFRKQMPENMSSQKGGGATASGGEGAAETLKKSDNAPVSARRLFRFGLDQGPTYRKGARVALSMKRREVSTVVQRSRSIGALSFRTMGPLDEEDNGALPRSNLKSSDTLLAAQIHELVEALNECQQKLTRVRMEADRNRSELRSEVYRLKEVISSFSQTQELQYRSLLSGLDENYRTLGHVESSFDYFSSLLNRFKRSTFQYQLKHITFFLLDRFVAASLALVHGATAFYCQLRPEYRSPNNAVSP